jgi:hypothetical protein
MEGLGFQAMLASGHPDEVRRQFVVSYYSSDKTLAIFEAVVPNSGFRGGKFLQRMKVINPATKQPCELSAFYIGAHIHSSGREFELVDTAPKTLEWMEGMPDKCPEANIAVAVKNIISIAKAGPKSVRALFEDYDPQKTGYVRTDEAKSIFSKFVPQITKHAVITLVRAYDREDGTYDYGLLLLVARS